MQSRTRIEEDLKAVEASLVNCKKAQRELAGHIRELEQKHYLLNRQLASVVAEQTFFERPVGVKRAISLPPINQLSLFSALIARQYTAANKLLVGADLNAIYQDPDTKRLDQVTDEAGKFLKLQHGATPLIAAVRLLCCPNVGDKDVRALTAIIQLMLAAKVNVNAKDCFGRTALHWAVKCPNLSLRILTNAGAKAVPDNKGLYPDDLISLPTSPRAPHSQFHPPVRPAGRCSLPVIEQPRIIRRSVF